jgi:hypothetical protein
MFRRPSNFQRIRPLMPPSPIADEQDRFYDAYYPVVGILTAAEIEVADLEMTIGDEPRSNPDLTAELEAARGRVEALREELAAQESLYLGLFDQQIEDELATPSEGGASALLDSDGPIRGIIEGLLVSLAPSFIPAQSQSPLPPNEAVGVNSEVSPSVRARLIDSSAEPVVAFQYHGVNIEMLGPLAATNRTITIEGVCIDHGGRNTWYIDWNFVMSQLGIVASQRPMLGEQPLAQPVLLPDGSAELLPDGSPQIDLVIHPMVPAEE